MNLLTAITELISIFLFTTLFIFVARKVAKKIGLVDKPNYRKRHQGLIPLVGGISVYAGICFTFAIADYYIPHASLYLACAGVLVLVGALDDRFDISVKIRAVIQAAIAVIMMMAGNLHLSSLGFIFGSWELVLGPFGFFLTLFAVWAAINAFNMVDGIDGLLGGLSSVSFAATGIILWFDGQYSQQQSGKHRWNKNQKLSGGDVTQSPHRPNDKGFQRFLFAEVLQYLHDSTYAR